MKIGYALEVVSKPGYFIGEDMSMPSRQTDRVPVFATAEEAEQYRWHRDALVAMASRVIAVEWSTSDRNGGI